MTLLDGAVFVVYMAGVLGIGLYFFLKNESSEDFFVGGRRVPASHVGLSIAATDVGGGFSIGLGGLGYAIGLSGSWLLFTGLVGAWLSAVFLIPRVKAVDAEQGMLTYPDFLRFKYDGNVALLAAVISGVGYLGFTGAQVLAGAKLMTGSVLEGPVFGMPPLQFSLIFIGGIIIAYTVLGGLKAVIYTDTVQWIVLMAGLILLGIPFSLHEVGGMKALAAAVPDGHFSLLNAAPAEFLNWMVSIIPIWLIGMTLYQRMYACRGEKEAKKAWFIAGLFEYPVMAFVGVFLGVCARALFADVESEMAVPILLKTVLPAGVMGLVLASYFSAIMSTADSCLMASSGHLVSDLWSRFRKREGAGEAPIRVSQAATLLLGVLAVALASRFNQVLDAILHAYAFMVSGLFVPTLGAYFWEGRSSVGALAGMVCGGGLTLTLTLLGTPLPFALSPVLFGIALSAAAFVVGSAIFPDRKPLSAAQEEL